MVAPQQDVFGQLDQVVDLVCQRVGCTPAEALQIARAVSVPNSPAPLQNHRDWVSAVVACDPRYCGVPVEAAHRVLSTANQTLRWHVESEAEGHVLANGMLPDRWVDMVPPEAFLGLAGCSVDTDEEAADDDSPPWDEDPPPPTDEDAPEEDEEAVGDDTSEQLETEYPIELVKRAAYYAESDIPTVVEMLDRMTADKLGPTSTRDGYPHLWATWVGCVLAADEDFYTDDPVQARGFYLGGSPSREGCQIRRFLARGRVPDLWIERIPTLLKERGISQDSQSVRRAEAETSKFSTDPSVQEESSTPPDETSRLPAQVPTPSAPVSASTVEAGAPASSLAGLFAWLDNEGLSEDDLELRRSRLTASGFSTVVGHNPYEKPIQLYRSKVDGYSHPMNDSMRMGLILEPVALFLYHEWALRHDNAYRSTDQLEYAPGTMEHLRLDWVAASPDVVVRLGERVRNVQIKTTSQHWSELPTHIIDQVHIEWEVLRSHEAFVDPIVHVPVLSAFRGFSFRVWEVEINEDYLAELLEHGGAWWKRHVIAKVPPPIDTDDLEQVRLRYPRDEVGELVQADDFCERVLDRWVRLRRYVTKASSGEEKLKALLQGRIGENAGMVFASGHRMTCKANKNGTRVFRSNINRLLEKNQDV
ncbi:MAG: hypothetical protein GF364_22890 [Candidatus Lokiarchaeota archaeon]|nr:hypothetical protein [Candidatus Lokiarchaeota archaeon]